MLRRRIINDDSNETKKNENSFFLKKKLSINESNNEENETYNFKEESNSNNTQELNIAQWLINNVFTNDVIGRLKNNLVIPIPNIDSNSNPISWLDMAIKSYLKKDDITIVMNQIAKRESEFKNCENIAKDLEKENLELTDKFNLLSENLEIQKNKAFKLEKKAEQMIELSKFVEYNFDGVDGGDKVKNLLLESINGDSDDLASFIVPFSINSQNIIMLKKYMTNDLDKDINLYLDEIKILLQRISEKYIPQRKKLLEELANTISQNFIDIEFVSPEEYTLIEPKIHNIPPSGGQKVIEGISFAVIKKETKQTMIYADIVAK